VILVDNAKSRILDEFAKCLPVRLIHIPMLAVYNSPEPELSARIAHLGYAKRSKYSLDYDFCIQNSDLDPSLTSDCRINIPVHGLTLFRTPLSHWNKKSSPLLTACARIHKLIIQNCRWLLKTLATSMRDQPRKRELSFRNNKPNQKLRYARISYPLTTIYIPHAGMSFTIPSI
jgi:hypothetical protein